MFMLITVNYYQCNLILRMIKMAATGMLWVLSLLDYNLMERLRKN